MKFRDRSKTTYQQLNSTRLLERRACIEFFFNIGYFVLVWIRQSRLFRVRFNYEIVNF
jgi:hypothetical protein